MSDQQQPAGQSGAAGQPPAIPIGPVPMNWAINPGDMNGEGIVLVQIATPVGTFAFVVPKANATAIGQKFIEAGTGGLQISQQMPPGAPPRGPLG
ncbi:MAG: hypothetical protein E4H44_06005 [Candidatus Aminicenantes bacterium]|nr:MAG: hypothetical protein E4H44_06005 [Candidatus Aminicenantes bacterium]HUW00854.1 hypothetical protein [Acidimicrobiales bacterium]